jgi:hypothetical protein
MLSSIFIVGLALVPVTLSTATEQRETRPEKESIVAQTLLSVAAVGLAGAYWCAVSALKTWALLQGRRD